MKINKYFILIAAAVAAMSCAKEIAPELNETPEPDAELVPMTFTTTYDDETKVAYEDGATVWKVGDVIKVIAATGTATDFTATTVEGNIATFEGLTEKAETYYAVSPATAYVGNDIANGKIYANIPETQTAVAGSFDPKAFLSVASNSGTQLSFKNACAVVGFKLAEPTSVKSVRFTATGQTNLAGTGVVTTDAIPSHKWDGAYENRSAFDMITLKAPAGGFKADTEYYLTIRANKCPNGIKVYVEYDDAVKSRTSSSCLFPDGSLNRVRSLGTLDQNLKAITPHDSYNLGFDVMVAGKAINKATYGNATLITTESNSKGLNNNGVYFINSDVDGVSMNSGKSIVVIGNDVNKRSKVSRSGYSYIPATSENDYWVLSNIDFTITSTATYSLRLNGNDVCELLVMDNCSSNVPTATQYIYGDANNKVKEIIIKDSEFVVEPNSTNNFLNFAAEQTVDNVTFDNNVFYSADINKPATSFTLVSAGKTTVTDLTLNRNTFYRAYLSSENIVNCKSTDVNVTKNIFGLNADATANVFVIGGKISNEMNFNENGYIKNGASYSVLTVRNSSAGTGTNNSIASIGIDTSLWNPAEGKFVLNNGYGATR